MTKKRSSRSRSRQRNSGAATSGARQASSEAKKVDFSEEYRYVVSDLKRFGVLAIAMFATLVVLALVLG